MLPGAFDYNTFIQQIIDKGAKYYDNSNIIIPPMTKSQIMELTKKMKNFENFENFLHFLFHNLQELISLY